MRTESSADLASSYPSAGSTHSCVILRRIQFNTSTEVQIKENRLLADTFSTARPKENKK